MRDCIQRIQQQAWVSNFCFVMRTALAAITLTLALAACQTPRYKAFDQVRMGQTKTSVLESLGGPDRRIREEGRDRWIYVFYNKDVDTPSWKEIQFVDNKVTYLGEHIRPDETAEEIDRRNDAANREEEKRLAHEQQINDQHLGRIHSPSYDATNAGHSSNYLNDKQLEAEKHKKAPTFVPIQ